MSKKVSKIGFIACFIVSVILVILMYILPIFSRTKTQSGSIDYVGGFQDSFVTGRGISLFGISVPSGIISLLLLFAGSIILFVMWKTSNGDAHPVIFTIPNIIAVLTLIFVPVVSTSSSTSGDSFAWYSESSHGSLNTFGIIFFFLIILAGVGTYLFCHFEKRAY